jgi:O-antigen biosynthesis protein
MPITQTDGVAVPLPHHPPPRPRVDGKFIWLGDEKLYVRGATYGTFAADENGAAYPTPQAVDADFERMAKSGFNAVRTYTVPPAWLLDLAAEHALHVMVGLPWEHHVAFLEDKGQAQSIEARLRAGVASCAGHPAVLCYTVGNEVRAPIVRWYGRRRVERFLERLALAARDEDPEGLVTYVNYPTTEYLQLPFLDLVCFNVYLEARETLDAYLARLHNLVGDRPLVLAEVGLDSRRNGVDEQARSLSWQLRTAFQSACAGAFVFAWTDEWHINPLGEEGAGFEVDDWDFGITDRRRRPKPALAAVSEAFSEAPAPVDAQWPRISVVVCTHNGDPTLPECLSGLQALRYPDYEVIVVSDGSTDETATIAREHGFRLIERDHVGLAAARNAGLEAATGDIVAYIDDDAFPDPDWLTYLADAFTSAGWTGVGGPNVPPRYGNLVAEAVARAPGGPIHVLVSDREAEHIPGCNMAFRRSDLLAIGGFDPRFRAAGDDVDVCWRLQDHGGRLGFHPAAMVWHRRRSSIRGYWRQQRGYGEAEALLERKWPERYNWAGHLSWRGQLYGEASSAPLRPKRVRYGRWGTNPFQSLYEPRLGRLAGLRTMPERYVATLVLAAVSALGALWRPLLLALPLLVLIAAGVLADSLITGWRSTVAPPRRAVGVRLRLVATTALLHVLQPAARLRGRLRRGLTPWRRHGRAPLALPRRRSPEHWHEQWRAPEAILEGLERSLRRASAIVTRSGEFDRWDLEVREGWFASTRVLMAIEEYPHGRQLVRWRMWPRWPLGASALAAVGVALAVFAAVAGADAAAAILAVLSVALVARMARDAAAATGRMSSGVADIASSLAPDVAAAPGGAADEPAAEEARAA